jgi:iron complex outermembrane recepter protein
MEFRALVIGRMLAASLVFALFVRAETAVASATTTEAATDGASGADRSTSAGPSNSALEEIVVTAQRKEETLQKIPIAVTVVSGDQLTIRGVQDTSALSAAIPNLSTTSQGVYTQPYLRGVGSNAGNPNDEPSVATYVDGVYMASLWGDIFSFNNIERIEVLKGPQGTLFGRNATGGVIQIVTRDPTQAPSLEASVGYGNFNTVQSSVYATSGIATNLAADVAVIYNDNFDGYGRDIFRGVNILQREEVGVRSKWLWTPTDTTEVRLSGDYGSVHSSGSDYQLVQGVIGADGVTGYPGPYNTDTNWPNSLKDENYGASLHIDQDLGFSRLVSISAYRDVTARYLLDQDATPAPIANSALQGLSRTFSQELQLLSPTASKLQWLVGGYYFNGDFQYRPLSLVGLDAAPYAQEDIYTTQHTNSLSGYGQTTVEVLPGTKLTGGLRYTDERQDVSGSILGDGATLLDAPEQSQSFRRVTWRAAIDQQLSDSVLAYVSNNRGIKSGGFNLLDPTAPGYRPEVLDAYELGLKSELLEHTLRLNVAGFYYNYKDVQVQAIQNGSVVTYNAAAARLYGIDADVDWIPAENWKLSGGVGYVDAIYTNFTNAIFYPASPLDGAQTVGDATGHELVNAPRLTGNLTVAYNFTTGVGDWLLQESTSYRDKAYAGPDNRLAIPQYGLINGLVGWTAAGKKYGVQLWVHNLANKLYYTNRTEQSLGDIQIPGAPRTYGVTFNVKL